MDVKVDLQTTINIPSTDDPSIGGKDKVASAESVKVLKDIVDKKVELSEEQIKNINSIPEILEMIKELKDKIDIIENIENQNENKIASKGMIVWLGDSNENTSDLWKDKSGNGNDFTVVNCSWENGYLNNKGQGYCQCINEEFEKINSEISVTVKIKINESKRWCDLVSFGEGYLYLIQQENLKINLSTTDNGIGLWGYDLPMDLLNIGEGVEITYVLDSSKVEKLYINGELKGSTKYSSDIKCSKNLLLFTRDINSTARRHNAQMKYLLIYNRALTSEEVAKNYSINNLGEENNVDTSDKEDDEFQTGYFNDDRIISFTAKNSYFMSQTGNDSNSGKSLDEALLTIEGYQAKVNSGSFTESTLYIEDGEYLITKPINLYNGRFGNQCKVTLQGIGNRAEFTVANTLINSRFNKISMNNTTIYKYDLADLNLNFSYGADATSFQNAPFITCNGERMYIASYPHGDKWTVSAEDKAVSSGSNFYITAISGNDRNNLNYISNWDNVILDVFAVTPYFNYFEYVGSYLNSNGRITTRTNHGINVQGYSGGIMYRIINSKDLVTNPGEYFIDYQNKVLYFIPPTGVDITNSNTCKIQIVCNSITSAFYCNNTNKSSYEYYDGCNVHFNKVSFSGFRYRIFNQALSRMTFTKCRFANNCDYAVNIDQGRDLSFINCRFKGNSGMAIRIANSSNGVTRQNLISSNILIKGCNFENGGYCHTKMGYEFAIYLESIGAVVSNCTFNHHPGIVIRYQQNDNQIISNKFKDSCYILSDTGCIYTGRDVLARGNLVKDNYIYGIKPYNTRSNARSGIYLDDMASGNTIINNTVDGYAHGCQVGGGRYNTVSDNIFKNSTIPIWADQRGTSWCNLSNCYWAINYLNGSWRTNIWTDKYPNVANVPLKGQLNTTNSTNNEHALPRGNIISNNKFVNPQQDARIYDLVKSTGTVSNNKVISE